MTYCRAIHGGNFADCMKHALLVWTVRALARKAGPLPVLDTHAGRRHYNLATDAERTGKWRDEIAHLLASRTDKAVKGVGKGSSGSGWSWSARSTRSRDRGGRERSYPALKPSSSTLDFAPPPSRESRLRHAGQVTSLAGGSAQPEPAPGSAAQSAMRQCGVTA